MPGYASKLVDACILAHAQAHCLFRPERIFERRGRRIFARFGHDILLRERHQCLEAREVFRLVEGISAIFVLAVRSIALIDEPAADIALLIEDYRGRIARTQRLWRAIFAARIPKMKIALEDFSRVLRVDALARKICRARGPIRPRIIAEQARRSTVHHCRKRIGRRACRIVRRALALIQNNQRNLILPHESGKFASFHHLALNAQAPRAPKRAGEEDYRRGIALGGLCLLERRIKVHCPFAKTEIFANPGRVPGRVAGVFTGEYRAFRVLFALVVERKRHIPGPPGGGNGHILRPFARFPNDGRGRAARNAQHIRGNSHHVIRPRKRHQHLARHARNIFKTRFFRPRHQKLAAHIIPVIRREDIFHYPIPGTEILVQHRNKLLHGARARAGNRILAPGERDRYIALAGLRPIEPHIGELAARIVAAREHLHFGRCRGICRLRAKQHNRPRLYPRLKLRRIERQALELSAPAASHRAPIRQHRHIVRLGIRLCRLEIARPHPGRHPACHVRQSLFAIAEDSLRENRAKSRQNRLFHRLYLAFHSCSFLALRKGPRLFIMALFALSFPARMRTG